MKRISQIFKSEEIWIVILSLILLGLSYGPLIYNYLTPPPEGKVFLGSYGYPPDFWGKMISLQEGRLGHWQFTHKTTTTIPTPSSIIPFEYLLLGQLSRYFPIDPVVFFHLCRLLLSLIFLIVIYQLINNIFNQKIQRLVAYTLALFSTAMGNKGADFLEIWSPLGAFQRSAYYPHYLFSFIFLLLTIIFLNQALDKKDLRKLSWACFFGFLISLIHSPNTVSLYLSLVFYFLLEIYLNRKQKISFKKWSYKIFYLGIFLIVSILPVVYVFLLTRSYPWTLLMRGDAKFDLGRILPKTMLIFGIGPTMFLSFYGSWLILKKKVNFSRLLAPWSIIYIIGYCLTGSFFSFNSQRFLQTPFFVILAVLSTLALDEISLKIVSKRKIAQEKIFLALTLIILLISFPAIKRSLTINFDNFSWAGDYTYYTSPENLAAIRWLGKNTKEEDIVLADKINGELIAALAGNFPYVNIEITIFPDEHLYQLEKTVRDFYQQSDETEKSKKFLLDNKIRYVFWSEEEKSHSLTGKLNYPFLKKVYENPKVIIYEFRD